MTPALHPQTHEVLEDYRPVHHPLCSTQVLIKSFSLNTLLHIYLPVSPDELLNTAFCSSNSYKEAEELWRAAGKSPAEPENCGNAEKVRDGELRHRSKRL